MESAVASDTGIGNSLADESQSGSSSGGVNNENNIPEQPHYNASIQELLKAMRKKIQEKETTLRQKVRDDSSSLFAEPASLPVDRLHQLRIIKLACESLTPAEPQLPEPGSPLPALLALRMAQRTIEATKSSLVDVESRLASVRKRLEKEEANLHDSILITSALENRIAGLRETLSQESRKTLDESVNDLLESIQSRKVTYDRDVKKLVKAFNRFINSHLAPMLSAEEHGGPVVGGLDEQELHGGAQGSTTAPEGADFRALTEALLNASVSHGKNRSGAYINLQRDSAAARFLVRAKVAEYNPRDARQLRLVNFGERFDS